jgi:transcription initiation factor TFIIH subunit 4
MLPYLVDFGLIYIPHDTRQYFPTRLATALTSNPSAMRAIEDQASNGALESATNGFIIIETNYRLYAYTSSPLQISIIALFANMSMRFPTMCSARLSRESVRRAIGYGINAEQIIEYLRSNAHEQMRRYATATGKPVLPPTVTDQIRLWQLENERMSNIPGFLFKDFDSIEEYEAVSRYAEEVGVLRWRNDKKGMFFANKYEPIRDYLKSRKSVK